MTPVPPLHIGERNGQPFLIPYPACRSHAAIIGSTDENRAAITAAIAAHIHNCTQEQKPPPAVIVTSPDPTVTLETLLRVQHHEGRCIRSLNLDLEDFTNPLSSEIFDDARVCAQAVLAPIRDVTAPWPQGAREAFHAVIELAHHHNARVHADSAFSLADALNIVHDATPRPDALTSRPGPRLHTMLAHCPDPRTHHAVDEFLNLHPLNLQTIQQTADAIVRQFDTANRIYLPFHRETRTRDFLPKAIAPGSISVITTADHRAGAEAAAVILSWTASIIQRHMVLRKRQPYSARIPVYAFFAGFAATPSGPWGAMLAGMRKHDTYVTLADARLPPTPTGRAFFANVANLIVGQLPISQARIMAQELNTPGTPGAPVTAQDVANLGDDEFYARIATPQGMLPATRFRGHGPTMSFI